MRCIDQVDDILKMWQRKMAVEDLDDVAGIAIEHVGFQLYPLPPDQQGLDLRTLRVAAALVPASLVGDDSDEGCSDSASEE